MSTACRDTAPGVPAARCGSTRRTRRAGAAVRCAAWLLAAGMLPLAACTAGASESEPTAAVTLARAYAGNPTAAIDARTGTRYVAWIETRDSVADVYLSRRPGSGDASTVRVNHIAGDAAAHDQAPPQVAVGPEGNVYVVWHNNTHVPGRRFPASDLRMARSTDGGVTFEPAIHVNDDAGGLPSSHTFHDVAVAADGSILVSWIDGRARTRAEQERVHARSDPTRASHAGHVNHGLHEVHEMHEMHAAADVLPGSEVRVARSTDGGRSFGGSVVVADDVCPCCRTSIVADDGRVFVSYRVRTDDIRNIVVAGSADGGRSFASAVVVHDDGWKIDGCPHAGASLALDGAGRLHVAWYTGAADRQGIWHAVSEDGRSFGRPRPVQTGDWVPVSQVKLARAADGTIWAAWDDRREEHATVRIARVGPRGLDRAVHAVHGEHPAIGAGLDVLLVWRTRDGVARALELRGPRRAGGRVSQAD
jgi:hypothetical protein